MARLIIERGKERSLQRRHPWVFSTSIATLEGRARPGDTVEVVDARGEFLARAAFSPESRIRARVWTFDPTEPIDDAFFKRRLAQAVARRAALPELREQEGLRLVHAESDGLPGIVVDRYGDTAVIQLTSAGAEKWRRAIVGALTAATGCTRIYERSDADVRKLEGLEPVCGWILGDGGGVPPVIAEHGVRIEVDIAGGHKTGFYLDQRENRLLLRRLAPGKRVLNCFCYTGGFSLQALAGGAARVLSLDTSQPALDTARRNAALNGWGEDGPAEWRCANVFDELRRLREAGEQFDIIVLDPPKFAPTVRHADHASRAYKDINRLALQLLEPGGVLYTFSCSGGISADLFHKIVASAGADAGVDGYILERLGGAPDHPMTLEFPEGEYLKGLAVMRK